MDKIHKSMPYIPGQNQVLASYNDYQNEGRKHYVLWSGGYDSTLVLYEVLDAYGAENVVAISYKYPWLNGTKYKSEKDHREAIKAKLKLRGAKFTDFTHTEFDIQQHTISGDLLNTHCIMGLPQAVAWLLTIPLYMQDGSFIYDGSVKNDDLLVSIKEYYQMFEGICGVLNKNIYLRQPLLYMNKTQVLEKMMEYDLYEECWFCEMPNDVNKPCNECVPCKTHMTALIDLSINSKNELIRSNAAKMISKIHNG